MTNYNTYTEVETDTSGRHPVSVGHLVMGVAFLGLATIWLLLESDAIGNDDLRWFLPLPWLAAGLAGLLAVALTGRRSKPDYAPAPAYDEPEPLWAEPEGAADLDAKLDADIEAATKDAPRDMTRDTTRDTEKP
jgi:hypothetical protein